MVCRCEWAAFHCMTHHTDTILTLIVNHPHLDLWRITFFFEHWGAQLRSDFVACLTFHIILVHTKSSLSQNQDKRPQAKVQPCYFSAVQIFLSNVQLLRNPAPDPNPRVYHGTLQTPSTCLRSHQTGGVSLTRPELRAAHATRQEGICGRGRLGPCVRGELLSPLCTGSTRIYMFPLMHNRGRGHRRCSRNPDVHCSLQPAQALLHTIRMCSAPPAPEETIGGLGCYNGIHPAIQCPVSPLLQLEGFFPEVQNLVTVLSTRSQTHEFLLVRIGCHAFATKACLGFRMIWLADFCLSNTKWFSLLHHRWTRPAEPTLQTKLHTTCAGNTAQLGCAVLSNGLARQCCT